MMPVNPVEELLGGFLTSTLPMAKEKEIAIIGMKTLGASHYLIPQLGITAESLIRYALSHQITVALVGCSTPEEVRIVARVGSEQKTLSEQTNSDLVEKFKPYAERLAFYRGVL
jgi:predicted aldo/keto reductase-like oxidoreductase